MTYTIETYQGMLDMLLDIREIDPDKLQDPAAVLVNAKVATILKYGIWNDGSVEGIKPYQLFLSDV